MKLRGLSENSGSFDKRMKILAVAEKIFAEKGSINTTIAEIASEAGVVDSEIYQFFKNKEDLLNSVPFVRMKEVLTLLDEHLQGISSAGSRLRKMVWFHLMNHDLHPDYAKVLLLECRSSKDFYSSPAYQLIRDYARRLSDIIKQGVEGGEFRQDIDAVVVRDVILGTLDWESISKLAIGEIASNVADLDDIMSLIEAMIMVRGKDSTDKSERIVRAAERVFSEKGYLKAKITEIAKRAGVSEGTIYEYFENKNELLLSIPIRHFESDPDKLADSLFNVNTPLKKLKRFISFYYSNFINDEDFLKVFLLQIQLNRMFFNSPAFDRFRNYLKLFETIIQEGKVDGSFRADVNVRVFRNMVLGAFSHLALRWLMFDESKKFDKMQEISQVMDLLCSAVVTEAGTNS